MSDKKDDGDAIDEEGFGMLAAKLGKQEEEEVYVYRGYDIYTYFISNVDTYLGKAIVNKIRGTHVEGRTPHTIIGKFIILLTIRNFT